MTYTFGEVLAVNHKNYIRTMFEATRDGMLTLTHYPEDGSEEFDRTYPVNWDSQTAEALEKQFDKLRGHLRSGPANDRLRIPARWGLRRYVRVLLLLRLLLLLLRCRYRRCGSRECCSLLPSPSVLPGDVQLRREWRLHSRC